MKLVFTLNGREVRTDISPEDSLLQVLRERFGLLGTKEACGQGECGACTVIIDGKTVTSCIYPAVKAAGKSVITIEGLESGGQLHPIQQAFIDAGAVQCGYCTPGMVLSAKVLLDKNPSPTEEEVAWAMSGNICRCTGYTRILSAVLLAAERMRENGQRT